MPYEELLKLWVLGSLLVGVAAIPAGWLSDRWSRSGMMLVMFLGLGISSLLCGISYNQTTLFIGLTWDFLRYLSSKLLIVPKAKKTFGYQLMEFLEWELAWVVLDFFD